MRYRTAIATLLLVTWLLSTPAKPAESGGVTVPGFSVVEAAQADGIGIIGPTEAEPGDEIVLRLTGTPPLDLTLPLIEQLDWLMGDSRMYCYLAAPGQPLLPLEVRGELVFGFNGATMQPLLRIACGPPGQYRVLVDWNHGQHQLADHRLTVGGDQPDPEPDPEPDADPEPDPDPTPPPVIEPCVTILEEMDDRADGLEGAKLNAHLEQIRSHLKSLKVKWRLIDADQKAAEIPRDYLLNAGILDLPAIVIRDLSSDTIVAGFVFGADAAETIAKLKAAGVK